MNKMLVLGPLFLSLAACGTSQKKSTLEDTVSSNVATSTSEQIAFNNYESEINSRDQQIEELKRLLANKQSSTSIQPSSVSQSSDLLPPDAKPGQCFARVFTPPTFNSVSSQVLKSSGYDIVNVIPAQYTTETKQVLIKEESKELVVVPPVYGYAEEKVLVSPEIKELRKVPAVYGTKVEKVLIKPAHTVWKKGSGPITKIDESTGEIMCLVEVPAVYENVKSRIIESPETTKEVVVKPAVYKTVKRRVVKTPATTQEKIIPAQYDTVNVKKLVKAAQTTTKKVDPVYETVSKRIKITEGKIDWAPVLCDTNVNGDIVRQLQAELNTRQYNAGVVDGVYGWQTTQAVKKFQRDNKLAEGGLTIEVVDALGIKY